MEELHLAPFKAAVMEAGILGAMNSYNEYDSLSYSSFGYSNLAITPDQTCQDGLITVSCDITNSSDRDGDEVVQLYVNDQHSSVTTYIKVLRRFERTHIPAGETKTVTFQIVPQKHLALLDQSMNSVVEPGIFEVMVGSSSEDIRLEGSFTITPE